MRTERPAWVDDADPMTAPNDTQREALRRLRERERIFVRRVHQSRVHHSTRDALLRRHWIVIDELGYVTLTDSGRTAASG